eukprot:CAMPEP_0201553358 /NCGR_PEP_ID=MMETSP0173_2-20130828/26249_1 /ASSEMBLY_ACC=CAM_ASM_000268 /TAXON_ID=218659 /ORGANISM="Vexillifera sp., Strain DIVA3 564/2" /LENGTH=674 /DNA_ID=CAMNT_0047964081 /DNA_START=78 /DNA_END=2099 /DNA_ORIENTATION=-
MVEEIQAKQALPKKPEKYHIHRPSAESDTTAWLIPSQTLSTLHIKDQEILEVKNEPNVINLALSDGSDNWVWEFNPTANKTSGVRYDFSDNLVDMVRIASRVLKLNGRSDYVFKLLNVAAKQTRFLNVNCSLLEQDVPPGGYLIVVPVSSLSKIHCSSLNPSHSGWLIKSSVKSGKATGEKRRWCAVQDNFFFYFKSQTGQPSGVVSLEYYTLSSDRAGGKFQFELSYAGTGFTKTNANYILNTESVVDLEKWTRVTRRVCINGAGKNVFGVPLAKLLMRKDRTGDIPTIVERSVEYLEKYVKEEGIFRKSGSSMLISQFQSDFDCGGTVNFSSVSDPHAVAGILKLWLRSLPEPLLTFDLFDGFLQLLEESDADELTDGLRDLFSQLPPANYNLLKYLLPFIHKVSTFADTNLMTPSNLATVFGPNLLRPREDTMDLMMRLTPDINAIVEQIIKRGDVLFSSCSSSSSSSSSSSRTNRSNRPLFAKVTHDYTAQSDSELSVKAGNQVKICHKLDNGWMKVELNGKQGAVPEPYLSIIKKSEGTTGGWGRPQVGNKKKAARSSGFFGRSRKSGAFQSSGNMKQALPSGSPVRPRRTAVSPVVPARVAKPDRSSTDSTVVMGKAPAVPPIPPKELTLQALASQLAIVQHRLDQEIQKRKALQQQVDELHSYIEDS